jgi:hypothetical protein
LGAVARRNQTGPIVAIGSWLKVELPGFWLAERANVAVFFALTASASLFAAGAALDLVHQQALHDRLQGSLDAAVLAGLKAADSPQSAARAFFNADASRIDVTTESLSFDGSASALTGHATASFPTEFLGIFGSKRLYVSVTSTAVQSTDPVCVLALDPEGHKPCWPIVVRN